MNLIERHCWAEISIDAITHNYNFIKDCFDLPFYVVLKADAYGHGAKYLAQVYENLGAFGIAVSSFAEAMEIRRTGVKVPLLVLGYTDPTLAAQLSSNKISQCVYSLEYAKELEKNSLYPVDCHIKLDTGMGRIGFDLVGDKNNAFLELKQLLNLPTLRFTGLFTHFPVSDYLGEKEVQYTQKQIDLFNEAYTYLTQAGFEFKTVHGQNSAAILRKLKSNFNTMRAGIILYGENPADDIVGCELRSAMTIKSIVTHIKTIHQGQYVGYGIKFCASYETKVATVAMGYADGLPRHLKDVGHVMNIGGIEYPVIGICMDQCMLDVSGSDVKVGDEVIGMGGTGGTSFCAIANKTDTINYEIVCGVQKRVPRVYVKNGKVIHVENNI